MNHKLTITETLIIIQNKDFLTINLIKDFGLGMHVPVDQALYDVLNAAHEGRLGFEFGFALRLGSGWVIWSVLVLVLVLMLVLLLVLALVS